MTGGINEGQGSGKEKPWRGWGQMWLYWCVAQPTTVEAM